jgi:ISXO2-like transposase domain
VLSALRHERRGQARERQRRAAVPLQSLLQELQCADRDAPGPAAPQGALVRFRPGADGRRHGPGLGRALRRRRGHGVLLRCPSGRWRHRFLQALKTGTAPLRGIVEADETFVLDSRKGERHLDRPARKRGGKATKRGLSRQQVPILVAADRSGTTLSAVLPGVSALTIQAVLEPAIDKDALLVTDGAAVSPRCAADLGISHEALNQSAGERVRGELHIQTVNNRHQRLKAFLAPFQGIATKYLPNYLRWFLSVGLAAHPSSRACLNAALGLQPTVAVPS